MYKLLDVFTELGMTERSAKTMRTRISKELDIVPKEDYDFDELSKILTSMSGKYEKQAKKFLFDERAKDYNVDIKQVTLIEEQDDFDFIPKIFDLVWVGKGKERKKGTVSEKVVGNYAAVMMSEGDLAGQIVKIRVNDLYKRVRGEK